MYVSACSSLLQNHQLKCLQQLVIPVILQLTAQPAERTNYKLWLSRENGSSSLVSSSVLKASGDSTSMLSFADGRLSQLWQAALSSLCLSFPTCNKENTTDLQGKMLSECCFPGLSHSTFWGYAQCGIWSFPYCFLELAAAFCVVSHHSELLLTPFWRHEVYLHAPLIIRLKILLAPMQLLQNTLGVKPVPKSFLGLRKHTWDQN